MEPLADPRGEFFAGPFAEAAGCPELPFAAGLPLVVPVAIAFPADFGTACAFPCSVETFLAATDFDAVCPVAERFGAEKRTKTNSETRAKPNFKRGGCTIEVYQMALRGGFPARICLFSSIHHGKTNCQTINVARGLNQAPPASKCGRGRGFNRVRSRFSTTRQAACR